MRAAGFSLVRMGDLSWDSFEPSEGHFEFAWFDDVLKQMNEAGIKVILDIGGLPAPTWLHDKYPSANVVNQNGVMLQPARRYMEDISDPAYRERVRRFADALTSHYAHHSNQHQRQHSPLSHVRSSVWPASPRAMVG